MKKVLLVERHEALLDAMETLLDLKGFSSIITGDYENIMSLVISDKPDIIIMDVSLQNEDGRLICRQIKENPESNDICVILFSTSSQNLKDYRHYKADGILKKPFEIHEFMDVLALAN